MMSVDFPRISNTSGVAKAKIALSALAQRLPGLPRRLIRIRELTLTTNGTQSRPAKCVRNSLGLENVARAGEAEIDFNAQLSALHAQLCESPFSLAAETSPTRSGWQLRSRQKAFWLILWEATIWRC